MIWLALICSLLQWDSLGFYLSHGNALFSLWWKAKCMLRARGELADITEVSALAPDWSVLMQMRTSNLHSLIGPKGTFLIGYKWAAVLGWWTCWWGYNCAALIGEGKASVPLVEIGFQELLHKSWLRWQKQWGQAVQGRLLPEVEYVRGPCAEIAGKLCFLKFEPNLPPGALLNRYLFFQVSQYKSFSFCCTTKHTRHTTINCYCLYSGSAELPAYD